MIVTDFLARLQARRDYAGQIAAEPRCIEAREARFGSPAAALPHGLQALLAAEGIEQLYCHQAEALDAARAGEHLVISTGTASGKSLCYHLPVLAALIENPDARALYLFPAKALAYDQLGGLARLVASAGLEDVARPACYDGDTPTHKRAGIRRNASILLSNPDMLHQSILPYHAKWAGFFARLKYVVLDEIHSYRGIFGSHVAGVVLRLQRVCRHYGSDPQFICCSATVGNPLQLAEALTSRPMRLIDRDGSPRGRRWFVLWNPPWLPGAKVARRSGNVEAQQLMTALLEEGAGTITFARARVVAELIYKFVVDALRQGRADLAGRVRPYRGGYLPGERREIEQKLFSGELLGVCSTNALELGIDVGSLDAAIIVGFPQTLCSLWQQAGRAGRRSGESLVFYVAYDDPLDQYFMRNPDALFSRELESAVVDPANPHILAAQLGCAAAELPLSEPELAEFGESAGEIAAAMAQESRLRLTQGRYYWARSELPAAKTNLRTISDATYSILDVTAGRNEVIGQVDSIAAPELVHPEAIYLHQGESYVVRQLDLDLRQARVERFDGDYYTQPVLANDCRVLAERLAGEVFGGRRCFGDVRVQWQTTAFRKFKFYTLELIGQTVLDLPPLHINTSAAWLQPSEGVLKRTRAAGHKVSEAMCGIRNLLTVVLPPIAMCDRYDIGGVVDSSQLGTPTIFLYDRYEGGVGYARHGFEHADELLRMALALVFGCSCAEGCPGCVGPANLRPGQQHDPDLSRGYEVPDKAATISMLMTWGGS